jgi:hypothetical protein
LIHNARRLPHEQANFAFLIEKKQLPFLLWNLVSRNSSVVSRKQPLKRL